MVRSAQWPECADIYFTHDLLSIETVVYFWHGVRSTRGFLFQFGHRGTERVEDNRDIRRIKKRITIRFGIDEAVRIGFTEDISMTGMFIRTSNSTPPNSRVKIEFDLPEGSRVELEARVMWAKKVPANLFRLVKKSGMGVRFLCFHAGKEAFDDFFENIATPL
jgi:hypothetical protein